MKNIYLSNDDFNKINQKYQILSDHNAFRVLIIEYINNLNPNTNHEWINYITYSENKNNTIIYFKKYVIDIIKNTSIITKEYVENLMKKIINIIKKDNLILPICYLADILDIKNVNNLLQKKSKEFKLQIDFKIIDDKIKFYIKYNEIFECKTCEINIVINKLYSTYIQIQKKKKKIIFLIVDFTYFNCEDTLYELQSFMFNNNYWLDISFHFNENNFQNRCYLNSKLSYFIKYDIILLYHAFGFVNKINFENIKNKLIITIPTRLTPDRLYQAFREDTDIKNLNNNIIYWGKIKLEDVDNAIILKTSTNINNESPYNVYKHMFRDNVNLLNNKIKNVDVFTEYINVLLPKTNKFNNNILEKEDFFKLYDFDINKKLITIFIRWPKCLFESPHWTFINTMRQIYTNDSFIHTIIENLKNDYNILFKPHPGYFKTINNINYFNDNFSNKKKRIYFGHYGDKLILSKKTNNNVQDYKWYKDGKLIKENTNSLTFENIKYSDIGKYELNVSNKTYRITISIMKNDDTLDISQCNSDNSYFYLDNISLDYEWINKEYPGIRLIDKYKFLNIEYTNELYKYTNFTIVFSSTTCSVDSSLYNIPVLLISTKDKTKDWFNLNKYFFNLLSSDEKNELYKIYNNLDIYKKSIWNEGIHGICCGKKLYWEDIKDDLTVKLRNIIEKEEIYKKDFLKENPYFSTSHIASQNYVGKKIIEIINKHKLNEISNIKYNLCQNSVTVYQKQYINVLFKNEIITIEILKIPYVNNKFISSGVNFYIYCVNPLCKLKFKFDIKICNNEENVYIRLYTGIKWIVYKETQLNTKFQQIDITEDFNLENKSKWRLSTTSNKVGQKIIIKDIIINNI